MPPLLPVTLPRQSHTLSSPSIAFHDEARKPFGMPLEEYEAKNGGEAAWEKAMPGLQRFATILKENPSGPFCLGNTPSYADFIIVAFLEWCRVLQAGIFERIVGIDAAFQDVYDACGPWLERNNH